MDRTILKFLKAHKNTYVSGETISNALGVSRTAVWKHVKALKEAGYEIESSSRKGYRLLNEPDVLTEDELVLGMKTKWLGKTVRCFETIDSTNRYAKDHASELPHGALIVSEEQQSGRGRLGRDWTSTSGEGIWMSILLKPDIEPKDAPQITQVAAAALASTLRRICGLEALIKWPNDIVVGGKKLCGILTEMGAELGRVNHIVLGIGLNVNQSFFEPELSERATSIRLELGEAAARKPLLFALLQELEALLEPYLERKDFRPALDLCRRHSAVLGKRVKVIGRKGSKEVLAIRLNDEGALVVRDEQGDETALVSGEISIRSADGYI